MRFWTLFLLKFHIFGASYETCAKEGKVVLNSKYIIMASRIFFLAISLFYTVSVYSQNILTDINKYNLNKIEKQAIKKSRKLLKTDKERHLSAFTYFAVGLSDYFFQDSGLDDFYKYSKLSDKEIGTIDNFFKNLKLYDKENIDDFLKNFALCDKYRCYVYDDSLNIVAMSIEKQIIYLGTTTSLYSRYIEYITKINPEYIYEYIYCPISCPVYFCYKDGGIIIVYLSDDGKNIVSYPLSVKRTSLAQVYLPSDVIFNSQLVPIIAK